MKSLNIAKIYNSEFKKEITYLVLDNEVFDWGLDPQDLQNAINMINHNANSREAIINSIINHFVASFSEFVGKPMSLQEINQSITTGVIV